MSTEVQPIEDVLEAHEFGVPCGTRWHERWGAGDAGWVVWQFVCCEKRAEFGFACDACLQAALTYPGAAVCGDCGHRHEPARKSITRVEPLRRHSTEGAPQ